MCAQFIEKDGLIVCSKKSDYEIVNNISLTLLNFYKLTTVFALFTFYLLLVMKDWNLE